MFPEVVDGLTVNEVLLHITVVSDAITGFWFMVTSAAFVAIIEHPPVIAEKVTTQ